jgi:lipoprotein-anchoring transpeptidase ErfK/SrfK
MDIIDRNALRYVSRREFMKYSLSGFSAMFLLPLVGALPYSKNEAFPASETAHSSSLQPGNSAIPEKGRILGNSVGLYAKPSFSSQLLKMFYTDVVQSITEVTLGDNEPAYNRVWYQINNEGFIHSGSVQPVEIRNNQPITTYPGNPFLVELTVPFTDTLWTLKRPDYFAYRLYYGTTYWISGIKKDSSGKVWYQIQDDKWEELSFYADATHFHPIQHKEIAPLSPNVPVEEKRIEVNLPAQAVIAYEYDQPVFMTRAATGAHFSDGNFTTPSGHYITNRKRPSRHMAAGDPAAPNSYNLPGIPWVSYLTKSGISFHGTYWHNDFGKPRSHGCINLSIEAARWIYRWTFPTVPAGEDAWSEDTGTGVDVA